MQSRSLTRLHENVIWCEPPPRAAKNLSSHKSSPSVDASSGPKYREYVMRRKTLAIISGVAISAILIALAPQASAARGGYRGGGAYRGGVARGGAYRGGVAYRGGAYRGGVAYRGGAGYRGGYAYRGGYWRPGVGVAAGVGAAAIGAAAAGSYYNNNYYYNNGRCGYYPYPPCY
jgi:hypothetical protein